MSCVGCSRSKHSRLLQFGLLMFLLVSLIQPASAQNGGSTWRVASEGELKALLPARATVEKEHIETEMRTASGVTDGHGKFIAGVVLITAGYSADGKYSHFLVSHVPFNIGDISLPAGEYVFGWERKDEFLSVHLYDAATGALRGSVDAKRIPNSTRVESFRIWPPRSMSVIQIGRFGIPYQLQK
ncbi:MAG: hypothetical protein M3O31_09175 [Acidobacteriota bacterium]|nr:hypothetical protein [Acidobacteriota bacterium]